MWIRLEKGRVKRRQVDNRLGVIILLLLVAENPARSSSFLLPSSLTTAYMVSDVPR